MLCLLSTNTPLCLYSHYAYYSNVYWVGLCSLITAAHRAKTGILCMYMRGFLCGACTIGMAQKQRPGSGHIRREKRCAILILSSVLKTLSSTCSAVLFTNSAHIVCCFIWKLHNKCAVWLSISTQLCCFNTGAN